MVVDVVAGEQRIVRIDHQKAVDAEARAIAASIHRWIVTKSRMWHDGPAVYEATFLTIQSARGKKSAEARRQRAAEMWEQA